ncbi:MAG: DUF2474 domain-containing protein [Alphaproteobacteria bacterium]
MRPGLKKLVWFAALYGTSLAVISVVAYALRAVLLG